MEAIETLSYSELVNTTDLPLLVKQLRRMASCDGLYGSKLAAGGINSEDIKSWADFYRCPLTEKDDLLTEQQQYPPFGRLIGGPGWTPVSRTHMTSGSSGRPLYIALSRADVQANVEAGRRAFLCAGLTPDDGVVHCLNYCMWAGGITDHLSMEATGAAVIPFGVGNTKRLIEVMQELRPTAISCTPSYMARLEVVMREEGRISPRDLKLKKGLFGGEGGLQNAAFRARLEETWGIRAIDANYGMADVLSIFGAECEERIGLHYHGQGILHLDLIDPSTGKHLPVEPGASGEMVLTNLIRELQPVMRYRTRDIITVLGTDRCGCGRSSIRFRIEGRSDQMIVVRGVNVYPNAIKNLLAETPQWFSGEFEIILSGQPPYERPELRAELVPEMPINDETKTAFLVDACRRRLNFTPQVTLIGWGQLPRTEGKTKHIRLTGKIGA